MKRRALISLTVLFAALPLTAATIAGTANIFYSGQVNPGGTQGTDATLINLSGGTYVTFTGVTGNVNFCDFNLDAACQTTAEGTSIAYANPGTDLELNNNGISGITFIGRQFFLVGVFLDNNTPSGANPTVFQNYTNASSDATTFSPGLGKMFFVGDGQSVGGGVAQQFFIPTGATRLFLGFADGTPEFRGNVGAYDDNGGLITLTVNEVGGAVPEPTTMLLTGAGLLFAGFLRRRRS